MKKRKLIRISLDFLWCNFLPEIIKQNFNPKNMLWAAFLVNLKLRLLN